MSAAVRRLGVAGFTFFFVKGLVWIAIAMVTGHLI